MTLQTSIQRSIPSNPHRLPRQGIYLFTALVMLLGFTVSGIAHAQGLSSRTQTWEFLVAVPYVAAQSIEATGGSKIDTNSSVGMGFGIGYNFDEKLAMSVDIAWNSPSFDATIVSADDPPLDPRRDNGEMETSNWQINLRYHFMTGAFTPYITGGLGWTYIDSNIAAGPPEISCWWDPWYGNICYDYQPTYSDWRFSYNAAAGVRFDMNESVFMRASVGMGWIDLQGGNQDFTIGRFEIGFRM